LLHALHVLEVPVIKVRFGGLVKYVCTFLFLCVAPILDPNFDLGSQITSGDAGVVDEYDASDDMYAVTFAGVQWWCVDFFE